MTQLNTNIRPFTGGETDKYFHRFKLALRPGDILVLTDYTPDAQGNVRAYDVFELHSLEAEPPFRWKVISANGYFTHFGDHDSKQIHPFVKFRSTDPLQKVTTKRGVCTLFMVEVEHGYSLHFKDYVKNRYPNLYKKLSLS